MRSSVGCCFRLLVQQRLCTNSGIDRSPFAEGFKGRLWQ